ARYQTRLPATGLGFSPRARSFVVAALSGVFVFSFEDPSVVRTFELEGRAITIRVSTDRTKLLTMSDTVATVWSLDGQRLARVDNGSAGYVGVDPTGTLAAKTFDSSSRVEILDVAHDAHVATIEAAGSGLDASAFDPSGRLATASVQGVIELWDRSGQRVASW